MIRAVIFDWSGTLADDAWLTREVTNDVLRHFGGQPVDEVTYRREFQLPVENFYRPHIGEVSRDEVDRVFFQRFRARCTESRLFPGVQPLLWLLRQRGIRAAVLSSMETATLARLVDHFQLDSLLERVVGGAGDKRLRLSGLIQELHLPADQVLYLGDLENDVEAAREAGAIAAAVLYGYADADRLRALRPDYLLHDLDELFALLDRDYLLATERRVIPTVGGLLCNAGGEVLLVRTRKWSNRYGIPGGKIDYGETMLQAYYREIREETGLTIDNATWIATQDCIESEEFTEKRHFLLVNYFSRVRGRPEPKANYESNHIGWYPYPAALRMDLNGPTRVLLESPRVAGLVGECGG